jgi:protoporphyrinogen oxidase
VITGCEVVEIDVDQRAVVLSSGKEDRYETLISTMPLDVFAHMSGKEDWIEAAARLIHASTYVVGVGLEGACSPELKTKCWIYFPEESVPFHRVTHFSLYSPNNVDDINSHWSLMCEVSESLDKKVDPASVVGQTLRALVSTGLIRAADQVSHTWMHRVEHGYPLPTPGRDHALNSLLSQLYEKGILSRGRFGAWRYEVGNMDHSFMQGVEAAAHLLLGSPELTVWDPGFVNTRHPVIGWDRFR